MITTPEVHDVIPIVDTYVPVTKAYLDQLRWDVLWQIRALQQRQKIGWFCFLLHYYDQLGGREAPSEQLYIHLRLQPTNEVDFDAFVASLPPHFLKPIRTTVSEIAGLNVTLFRDKAWRRAWSLLGATSELVLQMLEAYEGDIPADQVAQLLHFITNPLKLGHRCAMALNERFVSF